MALPFGAFLGDGWLTPVSDAPEGCNCRICCANKWVKVRHDIADHLPHTEVNHLEPEANIEPQDSVEDWHVSHPSSFLAPERSESGPSQDPWGTGVESCFVRAVAGQTFCHDCITCHLDVLLCNFPEGFRFQELQSQDDSITTAKWIKSEWHKDGTDCTDVWLLHNCILCKHPKLAIVIFFNGGQLQPTSLDTPKHIDLVPQIAFSLQRGL